MLVTFTSKAHGDITMFGDVAVRLLKMMGQSGTVPGAINAEDIPAALERLKTAIAAEKATPAEEPPEQEDEDREDPPVSLALRAFPLIEMLDAAVREDCHVMWYQK